MEPIFYVYEHWRPDTGACFYVGKGKDNRAWNLNNRSKWHKAVTSKVIAFGFCIDVRMVKAGLTEEEAFILERERITFYGRDKLVNLTDGGEGASGARRTLEQRARQSESAKRRNEDQYYLDNLAKKTAERWMDPNYKERVRASQIASARLRKGIPRKPHSEETRKKIGDANRGMKRATMSEEVRAKIGNAHRGRKHSQETKDKISAAKLGKKLSPEHVEKLKNRPPMSAEGRARISASHHKDRKYARGPKHSNVTKEYLRQLGLERIDLFQQYAHLGPAASAKRVVCITDGKEFESASGAAVFYDVAKSALIELCLGKRGRKTVGGKVFKYMEAA